MGVPVSEDHEIKLVGAKNFKRHNPMSDRFKVLVVQLFRKVLSQ